LRQKYGRSFDRFHYEFLF